MVIYDIKLSKPRNNVKPQNKVHFYVARDKNGVLSLWFGKPYKEEYPWVFADNAILITINDGLNLYGLDIKDYDNLKCEDESVEVFLNMED